MIDVAIIGGGLAGLSAALRLSAQHRQVTVFEARNIPGGRSFSTHDGRCGRHVDNGQHLLMGCYTDTLDFLASSGGTGLRRVPRLRIPFVREGGARSVLATGRLPHPLGLVQGFLAYDLLSMRERLSVLLLALRLRWHRPDVHDLDDRTVTHWLEAMGQSARSIELLWEPVVLATMNTRCDSASAALFVTVLREIFLRSAEASALLLPERGLSEVLITPAVDAIERNGGRVVTGTPITRCGAGRDGFTLYDRKGTGHEARMIVFALPPWGLLPVLRDSDLLQELQDVLPSFTPASILSAHVRLRREITAEAMTGLLGSTVQWLFYKGRCDDGSFLYSCTISAADTIVDERNEALEQLLCDDLYRVFPRLDRGDILGVKPLRERAATFEPRPGLDSIRPSATTALPGLFLAGDWTATGLPATIESAVRSGHAAAGAVLGTRAH